MVTVRRGLPRTPGGEPWPLAEAGRLAAPGPAAPGTAAPALAVPGLAAAAVAPVAPVAVAVELPVPAAQPAHRVRRGLPRVPGGQPWPDTTGAPAAPAPTAALAQAPVAPPAPAQAPAAAPALAQVSAQAPASPAQAPVPPAPPARTPLRRGAARLGLWAAGAVVAAGIVVLAARGVTTLPGVPEFLARYPGEYEPAVQPDPGFPAWARWSHFLNFFFMVLIVRTGLLVRHQQKPPAFFASKRGGTKVSIYLWLHTSIDLLWLANGVAFVVLLFVSGHWARIVPTSWEVVPHAVSAMLQYLTLEWPAENGWVNYNALQQLMYFAVVFVAAPLAAVTGLRMSSRWPEDTERAERLNRVFPAPLARAVHYPVMLFFVLFVVVHVFLVFATGALANLNHMFAGTERVSWVGFAWFAAGLLVTAAVTWAARPLVLAPIAALFGRVSER